VSSQQPVLVTGASGFIGRHLCRHLRADGHIARGFSRSADDTPPRRDDRDERQSHCAGDSAASLRFARNDPGFRGDILDRKALDAACEGVGVVFHLAGIAQTVDQRNPWTLKATVEGARNVLAAARDAGASRLVFVSSALASALDHGQASGQAGDYAHGKWQAERLVLAANGGGGLLTTVLRPAPVYGTGMKGGLARMIRLIRARRLPPLPRLEHGMSLVGVEDVCRAALLAAQSPAAAGQCWLLTDLERYTANEIEGAVYQALGRAAPRWRTPAVVFSAAAAALQLGRLAGWQAAKSGLQTWRNLTRERVWPAGEIYQALDFQPAGTLYGQLPEIIRNLK